MDAEKQRNPQFAYLITHAQGQFLIVEYRGGEDSWVSLFAHIS